MPSSRSSQPLSEFVRMAWEGAAPREVPDLLGLIEGTAAARGTASEAEIADACVEDAEQRMERGLACRLEHYLEAVPVYAGVGEVARALLMLECSVRSSEGAEVVAADLRRRFPGLLEHVDAVVGMMALMRSVSPADAAPEIGAGTLLDEYRLEEWLGAGTFGEVWRAWDRTLERYVALKLIPSRGTEGVTLAAVIREAKSAASIDHENVVRVHDAGRFDAANLCYIDTQLAGDPAPQLSDAKHVAVAKSLAALVGEGHRGKGMSAKEGAALIGGVARGVAAAHARGIVHRDIKPSNIMVTPSGRPMVADFGLSALSTRTDEPRNVAGGGMGSATRSASRSMGTGRITGTPAFMAPEQARGEAATPASDVFSLGATLRFVLTGRLPFAPSGKYSRDERWDVIEQVRRFDCAPLAVERPDLPKDLTAICDHAMAPEASDRYLTAQSMADDITAYLEGRPVSARPAGTVRATVMWAGRNRTVVGLVMLMAVLGSAGLWRYIVNIGHERDRAVAAEAATAAQLRETEKARASAQSVNEFLQDILSAADPQVLGLNATVLDAVRLATPDIGRRFSGQPLVEADVRETVGFVYGAFGEVDAAREHLSRALELRRKFLGEKAPETYSVRHSLAKLAEDQVHQGETGEAIEALVKEMREVLGPDHRVTLVGEQSLIDVYASRHRLQEAFDLATSVVERRRKIGDGDSFAAMNAEQLRAAMLAYLGDPDESIRLLWALSDRQGHLLGATHYQRYTTLLDLAFSLKELGRWDDAATVYTVALEGLRPQLPPGHEMMMVLSKGLANILSTRLGRPQEALDLLKPAFDAYVARADHAPFQEASGHDIMGVCLLKLGRFPEAEVELLKAREGYIKKMGNATNDSVRAVDRFLSQTYEGLGMPEKACEHREMGRFRTGAANPPKR